MVMTQAAEYIRRCNKIHTLYLCHRLLAVVKPLVIHLVFWLQRSRAKSFTLFLWFLLNVINPN